MNNRIYPMQVDEIVKKIEDLKAKRGSISVEIAMKETELKEICPHNSSVEVNEYIEGGYLDIGKHIWILKCKICGKELDRKEKDTGHA